MSLSQLYALAKFPRVSNVCSRAKVATQTDDDNLYIAISGASLSHYVLKPSPKLVWSHSFPPSFEINSLVKFQGRYIVGVWNKNTRTHIIQVISALENGSEVEREWTVDSKVINLSHVADELVVSTESSTVCYSGADFKKKWAVDSLYKIVFQTIVESDVILQVEHNDDPSQEILHLRLISSAEGLELSSKITELSTHLANLTFAHANGYLIQFANGGFTTYSLPHFQTVSQLSLSQLNIELPSSAFTLKFESPSKDRILLTVGHDIYLINMKFGIVISHIHFKKSDLELLFVQSQRNQRQKQLFGVVLKESELSGVTFTLDSNTLKDSLGKKASAQPSSVYRSVPSILDIKQENIDVEALLNSEDLDSSLLTFMEARNDYYTEDDKVIESKVMNVIVKHVLDSPQLPERSMTYLLTHPLFPTVKDLLARLRSKPRLLRQAIVTGNVSVNELINELNTTENEEIFKDIITRLLEFPKEKLDFKDLDSFKIVERIIQLNFGYELISLLIDASGLFTWNEELIDKLQSVLTRKIDALNSASNLYAVVGEIQANNLKTVTRVPVYSIERLSI